MDAEATKTRKVKKQVRKGDLPIISGTSSLDQTKKDAAAEQEAAMIMEDKLVADTEDKKNELETYIYEMRNKIDDTYSEFANEDEKTKLKAKLEASEVSFDNSFVAQARLLILLQDWLYDEGEDATKAVYVAKMDEIRAVAGPIVQRYFDKIEEERAAQRAIEEAEAQKKKEMAEAARAAAMAQEAAATKDEEMTDADAAKPDEIVEPESK